jgi:hypothetical protein
MESLDDVIEPKTLTKAIGIVLKRENKTNYFVVQSIAEEYSELLLNHFGFDDRIIDKPLDEETRDVFYMLEDEGILSTLRETDSALMSVDKDGKSIFKVDWRTHYWVLKKNVIWQIIEEDAKTKSATKDIIESYDALYEKAFDDYAITPG